MCNILIKKTGSTSRIFYVMLSYISKRFSIYHKKISSACLHIFMSFLLSRYLQNNISIKNWEYMLCSQCKIMFSGISISLRERFIH